jgi:hypothetical protein
MALAGRRYEPVTSEIGFFQLDLTAATVAFEKRWQYAQCATSIRVTNEGLDSIRLLEPLQASPPRELLLECRNGWTGYFNCSMNGTDAGPAMSSLAHFAEVPTYVVTYITHENRGSRPFGLRFAKYEPGRGFDNLRRQLFLTFDMGKYTFEQYGEPEDFENLGAYRSRRKADRFTPQMLVTYTNSLGISFLEEDFYGHGGRLIEHWYVGPPDPSPAPVLIRRTIAEAQKHFEIP